MRIYKVASIERQDDWRFFDVVLEVFEGSSDKPSCCSVCMITDEKPVDQIRIILPYSKIKEIVNG